MRQSVTLVAAAVVLMGAAPATGIAFGGSPEALRKLEEAAKRCGFSQSQMNRKIAPTVLKIETRGFGDPRAECVIKWMLAHSEIDLSFVGNQAVLP